MEKLFLPLLLISVLTVSAQNTFKSDKVTDHSTYIKSNGLEAVIFDENYFQNPEDTVETKLKRFTPSTEDIMLTESILKEELKKNKKSADYKKILTRLKEYRRQYIGYYDKDGIKMIYINSFPNDLDWADEKVDVKGSKNKAPTWYNTLFTVFDGGNSFWQAHINLQKRSLKSLSVNSVA